MKSLPPSASILQIFKFLANSWDLAYQVEEEIRVLNYYGVTKTALIDNADSSLSSRARCILIGTVGVGQEAKQARVDVDFCVIPRVDQSMEDGSDGVVEKLQLHTEVAVSRIYGFPEEGSHKKVLSDAEMRDVILRKLGLKSKGVANLGKGSWGRSVGELALKVFS